MTAACASLPAVTSPHGGETAARQALNDRFAGRVAFDPEFTRRAVSYQGNRQARQAPGLRWMKYKEGFSRGLVDHLLDEYEPERVLDPFAGVGTMALVAAGRGMQAAGIEINAGRRRRRGRRLVESRPGRNGGRAPSAAGVGAGRRRRPCLPPRAGHRGSLSGRTEAALGKAREFIAEMPDGAAKTLVNLACMSVLEAVSFTRKDGQYLRWDARSAGHAAPGRRRYEEQAALHEVLCILRAHTSELGNRHVIRLLEG